MSTAVRGWLIVFAILVPCVLGAVMTRGRRQYPLFPSLVFWFGVYEIVWAGLIHPLAEHDTHYPQHPGAAVHVGIFCMLASAPWLYRARRAFRSRERINTEPTN